MNAYELAQHLIENDRDPDPTYVMGIEWASQLLAEFRSEENSGGIDDDVTAEALAEAYNEQAAEFYSEKRAFIVAEKIRKSSEWDMDLLAELCDLAGMSKEWDDADGDNFEDVVNAAAEKLGVEIY